MKPVEVYESVDGSLHRDEGKAVQHDLDCIGQEFDALLLEAMKATGGNVTRNDQYRMCLHLLNNRESVTSIIDKLYSYLHAQD